MGSTFDQKIVYIPEAIVIRIYSHEVTRHKASQEAMRSASEEMRLLAQENALLGEIGRIISSSLDIDDVYAGFAEQLRTLIHFDRLAISLVNLDDNTFANAYVLGDAVPGRQTGEVADLEGTVTNEAVISRRARVIQGDPKVLESAVSQLHRVSLRGARPHDLPWGAVRRPQRQVVVPERLHRKGCRDHVPGRR